MKYLDKKIKINANGESYESGYIVELSKEEVQNLIKSLEFSQEYHDNWKEEKELAEKLSQLSYLASNGFTNYEID